jgi:hypothetical protein
MIPASRPRRKKRKHPFSRKALIIGFSAGFLTLVAVVCMAWLALRESRPGTDELAQMTGRFQLRITYATVDHEGKERGRHSLLSDLPVIEASYDRDWQVQFFEKVTTFKHHRAENHPLEAELRKALTKFPAGPARDMLAQEARAAKLTLRVKEGRFVVEVSELPEASPASEEQRYEVNYDQTGRESSRGSPPPPDAIIRVESENRGRGGKLQRRFVRYIIPERLSFPQFTCELVKVDGPAG